MPPRFPFKSMRAPPAGIAPQVPDMTPPERVPYAVIAPSSSSSQDALSPGDTPFQQSPEFSQSDEREVDRFLLNATEDAQTPSPMKYEDYGNAPEDIPIKEEYEEEKIGEDEDAEHESEQDAEHESEEEAEEVKPARRRVRTYNLGLQTAMASYYELPRMIIGALELLTYFPFHAVRWPEIMFRLYRAGWKPRNIAKAQLYARGTLTVDEWQKRFESNRHAIGVAGRTKFGPTFKGVTHANHCNDPALQPVKLADFDRSNGFPNGILEHYDVTDAEPAPNEKKMSEIPATLQQLTNGVVHHPIGQHRGLVTQAIEWASQQDRPFRKPDGTQYNTKDIMGIVIAQGFQLPALAHTAQWDTDAAVEMLNRIPDPT